MVCGRGHVVESTPSIREFHGLPCILDGALLSDGNSCGQPEIENGDRYFPVGRKHVRAFAYVHAGESMCVCVCLWDSVGLT